jgi:uncharacterized protein (DUF697 family)
MAHTATLEPTAAENTPASQVPAVEQANASKMELSERMVWTANTIKNHAFGAMGIGLIPVPAADFIALTALQINLLRKLSNFYAVPFTEDVGQKVIGALIGGYAPLALVMPAISLFKAIPLVGQTVGVLAMPVLASATTYAIGKVFVQHFESGGTFLNFNPSAVREYYRQQFEEGKTVAKTGN